MKKYIPIFLLIFVLITLSIPEARTVILTGAGNVLLSITSQNATDDGNGNVTIAVDTLESSVIFKNTSGIIRWDSEQLEFSNNAGTNYYPFGEGGNVLYGLSDDGTGTLASVTTAVTNINTAFFQTNWHVRALIKKDILADVETLLLLENSTYSATRLELAINASEQPTLTVGTTIQATPGTTTYTCTDSLLSSAITQAVSTGSQFLLEFDYDGTNDELVCCISGQCGAAIAAATDFDQDTTANETIKIGNGGDWTIYYVSFAKVSYYTASTYYTITGKPDICYQCTAEWSFEEKTGSTLSDSSGSLDLTVVDGIWGQ